MKNSSEKLPLMKRNWKIVDHAKWYFIVSAIILIIGLVLTFTVGPKMGIDFKSGFVIQVEYDMGQLTNENQAAKKNEITAMLEGLKTSDGTSYRIRVSDTRYQGADEKRTIRFVYQSEYLNNLAEDEDAYAAAEEDIVSQLREKLVVADNPYMINVAASGKTSPTISSELQLTALVAIIAACVAMLLYVMFRFELASGIAAIIALVHDLGMMFVFMVFCQVEINSTFIAALVAILGYSINNTLVVFDRVRENTRNNEDKNKPVKSIVNDALRDTFSRSVNTTVTTLFAMVMLAILGVSSIQVFAFPIIVGIVMGAYSSFCISPSIYVLLKNAEKKRTAKKAKTRLKNNQNKRIGD